MANYTAASLGLPCHCYLWNWDIILGVCSPIFRGSSAVINLCGPLRLVDVLQRWAPSRSWWVWSWEWDVSYCLLLVIITAGKKNESDWTRWRPDISLSNFLLAGWVRLDCFQLRSVRRHGFGLSSSAGLAKWLADIIEKRDAIHAAVDKKLESIGLRLQEAERKIEVMEITIVGPNAALAENAKGQVVRRAEVQLMIWKISADWVWSSWWENLVNILTEKQRDSCACCRVLVELHKC